MAMITASPRHGVRLPAATFSGVQSRLAGLVTQHRITAVWWADLARELDCLADIVASAPGDLVDPDGFTEQLRADAPHLMSRWTRLRRDGQALATHVAQTRLLVAEQAADPNAVQAVTAEVGDLLARCRRFQQRTTEVLLDAYERDIGGE